MSAGRKIKRNQERKQGKFVNCPKCRNKLVSKDGYGLVCDKCGYIKPKGASNDGK